MLVGGTTTIQHRFHEWPAPYPQVVAEAGAAGHRGGTKSSLGPVAYSNNSNNSHFGSSSPNMVPLDPMSLAPGTVLTGAAALPYAASYDPARLITQPPPASASERKGFFFGLCCPPARTFCCGCPLRDAVRWIGVGCLVWGLIGMFNNYVVMDSVRIHTAVLNMVSTLLLLALGFCCWRAASTVKPKPALIGIGVLAVSLIIAVGGTVAALMVFKSTEFRKRLISEFVRKFEEETHRHPTTDDMAIGERAADTVIPALIAVLAIRCIAEIFLSLIVVYILWSFVVRVKNGEILLVTHGVYVLPTVVVVTPQQVAQGEGRPRGEQNELATANPLDRYPARHATDRLLAPETGMPAGPTTTVGGTPMPDLPV